MTPAEWIIAVMVVYWVVRGGLADLVAAARGGTPERVAEGRARARGGRYGLRSYMGDLWGDAWRVARARREKRVEQRLEHIREHGPGPTWRQRASERWSAAWGRWEARMADRWQERRDGQRPAPEPVAPTTTDRDRPGGTQERTQEPRVDAERVGQEDEQREPAEPQTGDDPGSPGAGRPGPPRRGDQDDAARPGQSGPELTARPTGDGRWVVDPDPHRAGETSRERRDDDMAEVTGLASALAHATAMRRAYEDSTADSEQYLAGLESGGVTGEALAAVQQAMEAQQQAAAAWARTEAILQRHMQVREAYEANRDAGSKEFVTSE